MNLYRAVETEEMIFLAVPTAVRMVNGSMEARQLVGRRLLRLHRGSLAQLCCREAGHAPGSGAENVSKCWLERKNG